MIPNICIENKIIIFSVQKAIPKNLNEYLKNIQHIVSDHFSENPKSTPTLDVERSILILPSQLDFVLQEVIQKRTLWEKIRDYVCDFFQWDFGIRPTKRIIQEIKNSIKPELVILFWVKTFNPHFIQVGAFVDHLFSLVEKIKEDNTAVFSSFLAAMFCTKQQILKYIAQKKEYKNLEEFLKNQGSPFDEHLEKKCVNFIKESFANKNYTLYFRLCRSTIENMPVERKEGIIDNLTDILFTQKNVLSSFSEKNMISFAGTEYCQKFKSKIQNSKIEARTKAEWLKELP